MSARPDVFHVEVTSRTGVKVEGVYQFHEREDAESFAAAMNGKGYTTQITEGPLKTQEVRASEISSDDYLANGHVLVTRTYYGIGTVRVSGLRMGETGNRSRLVRRSYKPTQLVEIEARR